MNKSSQGRTGEKKPSVSVLEANLKRIEKILQSPHVRPVDYSIRDRVARQLRDAQKLSA